MEDGALKGRLKSSIKRQRKWPKKERGKITHTLSCCDWLDALLLISVGILIGLLASMILLILF